MAKSLAPLAAVGGAFVVLLADFMWHDVAAVNRWRMLHKLRACRVPVTALTQPIRVLPTGQSRLVLGPLPTMVLGETGSGKSVALAQVARETAQPPVGSGIAPCPVVYIRMRQPKAHTAGVSASSSETDDKAEATNRLAATARQVYSQIGFPPRQSYLSAFSASLKRLKVWEVEWQGFARSAPRDRMVEALRMLFDVAEQLYVERREAGVPEQHAPIVLLFDEVQDLIKSKRLAEAGGRYVFDELAVLLVAYGVDRRFVRTAVAGSSALLSVEFDTTVASGTRWSYHQMEDPAPEAVVQALGDMGYSAAEAASMVELVGTRLRLLEAPLTKGAAAVDASGFIRSARQVAVGHFDDILRKGKLAPDSRRGLIDVLERIREFEAGMGSQPSLSDMSEALIALDLSKVLYVRVDRCLAFQSRLHSKVWAELRTKYVE